MYTRWHSQAPSAETQWQPETKEQLAVQTAIVPTAVVACATGDTDDAHSLGRTYLDNTTAGEMTMTTCWEFTSTSDNESMTNTFSVNNQ